MSINDGQRVRALESNAAWVSKTATTGNKVTGTIDLDNATSGAQIPNAQQQINDTNDRSIQNEADITALDVRVTNNEADIAQAQTDIIDNRTDVDDLRTLSGTLDGETDLGTFTGTTIADNVAIKPALQSLETEVELKEDAANKGVAGGYASLDGGGLVPASQLPSYVDDVLEYANFAAFPVTGETGKIYVALDTNKTYRWSGATYILLNEGGVVTVQGRSGVTLIYKIANDNTSGSNVALAAIPLTAQDLTSVIRLTNAALVSIDTIPAGYSGQPLTLVNRTTVAIDVSNDTGATAADRILTGTGSTLTLEVDASLNLVYDDTTARWQIVGGSGSGGSSIATPVTTIIGRVPVFGDVTGTQLDQSLMSVVAGVGSGLTENTVGTVKQSANKIEGTASNTDFDLDANGTGTVRALAPLKLNEQLLNTAQTDASATGDNATLAAPLNTILKITNASLLSIEGITAGLSDQEITLVNKTGNTVRLISQTGTAANQLVLANDQDALLANNAAVKMFYESTSTKWHVLNTNSVTVSTNTSWVSYTPTISTDSGTLPTRSSETFKYREDGPDILVEFDVRFSGTGTGTGFYQFTLPTGKSIDTAVTNVDNFTSMGQFGSGGWYDNSASPQGVIMAAGTGSTTVIRFYGGGVLSNVPTNASIGAADRFSGVFRIPILEQRNNSFRGIVSQSVIPIAVATKTAGTLAAAANLTSFTSKSIDTTNSLNIATGVFTVPVAGSYDVILHINHNPVGIIPAGIKVNGVFYKDLYSMEVSAFYRQKAILIPNLSVGDTLQIASGSGSSVNYDQIVFSVALRSGTQTAIIQTNKTVSIKEVLAPGTNGGASGTATTQDRSINTITDPFLLLSASTGTTFTPKSGTYRFWASVPAYETGRHQGVLRTSANVDVIVGTSEVSTTNVGNRSVISGILVADGSTIYKVSQYTETAKATNGLGRASASGRSEVYTEIFLDKIGG